MHRPLRPAQCACAIALILAHLLVIAVAGNPGFHECLHGDADHGHHECAASVYAGGQLDQPVVSMAPITPAGPAPETAFLPPDFSSDPVAIAATSQERAPPAA